MIRNTIHKGDCLELMPKLIDDKSIDMIFCDLPYGTTKCNWVVIDVKNDRCTTCGKGYTYS